MAAKFQLNPKPTFSLSVNIPRAGGEDQEINFIANHMKTDALEDLQKSMADKLADLREQERSDEVREQEYMILADYLLAILKDWDVDAPFDAASLILMMANYPRSFAAISEAYMAEIWSVREKR